MNAFKVQMLTSPGVRKDQHNDQELGEDAIGFTVINDYAVLWIADGAPGTKIEFKGYNFGSRVLAKYMGECFESVALKYDMSRMPLDKAFLDEYTTELRGRLVNRLANVHTQLAKVKDKVNLDDALEIKMTGVQKSYALTWSATFVGAIVDLKHNVCYTVSIGDCIALSDGSVTLKYDAPIPEPIPDPVLSNVPSLPPAPKPLNLTKKYVTYPAIPSADVNALSVTDNNKWLFPPLKYKPIIIRHSMKERSLKFTCSALKSATNTSDKITCECSKITKSSSVALDKASDKFGKAANNFGDASYNAVNNGVTKLSSASAKAINGIVKGYDKSIDKIINAAVSIVYYKQIAAKKKIEETNRKVKEFEEAAAKERAALKSASDKASIEPTTVTIPIAVDDKAGVQSTSVVVPVVEELPKEPPKMKVITGRANRMFVMWSTPEKLDSFEVEYTVNNPCFGEIEDVKSIILMSDGVIPYNEVECKFGYKDPDDIWNDLKALNSITDDDKTAIYFKILRQN